MKWAAMICSRSTLGGVGSNQKDSVSTSVAPIDSLGISYNPNDHKSLARAYEDET